MTLYSSVQTLTTFRHH